MRPTRLTALRPGQSTLSDAFWRPWQERMATEGLRHQWEMCEETGRIENLRRCARGESDGYQGYRFNDSDVYKLIEASAYAAHVRPDPSVAKYVGETVTTIETAQRTDGYINSHVQLSYPQYQWKSLHSMHEMYCIGHLIEAGVATAQCTRDRSFYEVARKAADHVCSTFGPGLRLGYPGHPEIELALHRLALESGERKYADTARWMVESRGGRPSPFAAEIADPDVYAIGPAAADLFMKDSLYDGSYAQDDVPLAEQSRAVGHAVRAMYLYCAAVDLRCSDRGTLDALEHIWNHLSSSQTYVTGGIGSSGKNEGFGRDFDLPNRDAYAETCAGIGLVMWSWRMFLLTGNGRYADVMERALYNAVLSGVSFDCKSYFYDNPLESDGSHLRRPWFECACCPPNVARLMLSVGSYCVAVGESEITVALPVAGTFQAPCARVVIVGDYPWSGDFELLIEEVRGLSTVRLRIPDWTWGAEATINGTPITLEPINGLVMISREWRAGDCLSVSYKMPSEWLAADSRVLDCAGRVALRRGPLVYCLEEADLGHAPHLWSADTEEAVTVSSHGGLGPIKKTLEATGYLDGHRARTLYSAHSGKSDVQVSARFVPYFAWANREPGGMQVWVRRAR